MIIKNSVEHSKKTFILAFLILISFLCACSEKTTDPEVEIQQYIEALKLAAENRSYSSLDELIHTAYKDHRGLDKKQLVKMARGYFFTHKNINLFTQINSIEFLNENNAFVKVHIAMAGNVITDIDSLSTLRARFYLFELQLTKDKTWLLKQAKWQEASIKDMLQV